MCLMNPMKINRGEDITVYKVLGVDENGVLHSPIHDYEWPVGETQEINDKADIKEHTYFNYRATSVNGNAFHSFSEKEIAERDAIERHINRCKRYPKYVIAECVIPGDSKFIYLGAFKHMDDSYASEKLRVVSFEDVKIPEEEKHKITAF